MSTNTIFGTISADGNIISGSGFSVKKQSTGKYLIDFNENFSEIPAIVGSQTGYGEGEGPTDVIVFPFLERGFATALTGNGEFIASDRQFSFIAIGKK
ncbi:conserved protein of unknown function [Tenacibaculum sp. 190524A02b]|uniref:hypothetical protein n=1 Tax=Tenacibaculum vairaonense TaxID=3137860 RepID=UPI0032B2F228